MEKLGLLLLGLLISLVVVELKLLVGLVQGPLGPLVIVELQQLVSLGLFMSLRLIVLVEFLLVDLEQLQGLLVGLELTRGLKGLLKGPHWAWNGTQPISGSVNGPGANNRPSP